MAGINLFYNFSNPTKLQKKQKEDLIKKNYDEIYAHEAEHKAAAGALAGSIVIEKTPDGIPFAGHVEIKMPSLNPKNPQKTIDDANTVIRSAMAPTNPSKQDYLVAFEANKIKMQAQAVKDKKTGNNLDIKA